MTSYPAHLTVADIVDDIDVDRQTAQRWISRGHLNGVKSVGFWVVTGPDYIKFLNTQLEYRQKSDYYKSFRSYMRRKKDVQKTKKES